MTSAIWQGVVVGLRFSFICSNSLVTLEKNSPPKMASRFDLTSALGMEFTRPLNVSRKYWVLLMFSSTNAHVSGGTFGFVHCSNLLKIL